MASIGTLLLCLEHCRCRKKWRTTFLEVKLDDFGYVFNFFFLYLVSTSSHNSRLKVNSLMFELVNKLFFSLEKGTKSDKKYLQ